MNSEISNVECKSCGHSWYPRIARPMQCPRCKSYYWDEDEEEDD